MPARIVLRHPSNKDQREFLAAVRRSVQIHRPWVRAPASAAQYREYLSRQDERTHWSLLVCRKDTGALVGVINISNAVRGAFHSTYLGYYVFAGHERQGLMRQGLQAVIRHAFRKLKLHRLEANIQQWLSSGLAAFRRKAFRQGI
jgi:ribosomal-protein-alanine N-acetyltransferase